MKAGTCNGLTAIVGMLLLIALGYEVLSPKMDKKHWIRVIHQNYQLGPTLDGDDPEFAMRQYSCGYSIAKRLSLPRAVTFVSGRTLPLRSGSESDVNMLVELLKDPDLRVQLYAFESVALSNICDQRINRLLLDLTNSDQEYCGYSIGKCAERAYALTNGLEYKQRRIN